MEVSVGSKVAARGLEWDVVAVEPLGSQQRVRLTCAGGDLAGLEWDVLHPAEALSILRTDPQPDEAGTLADWRRYHIARLLEQIPGVPTPPGRVAIEAYQRVPLLRALDMVRPRLLLADGVGLGKTIQAGLIASELLIRRRAHRILIVCPPGPLLHQWEQEMRLRFGLRFTAIADSASLRNARRGLELGGNPFEATALCLTSMDFAKSDHVLTELERTTWDLVIIDEAHHCVGTENQRRRLAEVLAAQSDGLLLLTATPHDGHDPHFASLIALLDPSLVDGAGGLAGHAYRRHVVRRLKSHIRTETGAPMFRDRIVIPVAVDVTDAPLVGQFHQALSALVAPRLQRTRDRNGLADALAFVSLLKRSMSTIAACLETLRVVAERYGTQPLRERQRALRTYRRRMAQFGILGATEEAEIAELEAEEMASSLSDAGTATGLHDLIRLGEAALPHDPKLKALLLEVRLIRLRHPGANILVYTEYADSQRAAVAALADIDGTVLTISGDNTETERSEAAERCAEQHCIILVSTDSLAEGLNLHQRCFHLIHLDLPYNPNRLEQRNGRIDRYGQRFDPEIRYLFLAGTFEERLLLRLIAKYEKARAHLSFMPNTLGVGADPASLAEPLFAGFAEDLFSTMPRLIHSLDLAAEDTDSEAYRGLLREIDRAFQSFDHMAVRHGWLSGTEIRETPRPEAESRIDLPAFVASVLISDGDAYRVPSAWAQDLDGLPGFDRHGGTVLLTADPARTRDGHGRALLYPGRSHPLTRRAIAAVRTGRVSAAKGDTLALLVTYAVEIGRLSRTVFALRLYSDGAIVEQPDLLALPEHAVSPDGLWRSMFADWAPDALVAAQVPATAIAHRLRERVACEHHDRRQRQAAQAGAWLARRAVELCGPVRPLTGDLFDTEPPATHWRSCADAEQRLNGFAAAETIPPMQRRAAADTLLRYRGLTAAWPDLPQPTHAHPRPADACAVTLDLTDCTLTGSAITTPFLRDGLARVLELPRGVDLGWDRLRGSLRSGGAHRVHQHVTTKLSTALGYSRPARQDPVTTREGEEDGGWLLQATLGTKLRAWSIASDTDLDVPERNARAYRWSPTRVAQRVLRTHGERAGLLTNGEALRLLLCDPSRADSHMTIELSAWRQAPLPPDSFRLLLALAGADGLTSLPRVLDAARLHQAQVTTELRRKAREAIAGFLNALPCRGGLDPAVLWREGLVLVYRLLFILKLESPGEPGAGFSFASAQLWREALSPNRALAPLVRRHLDHGHDTGRMLEIGLRSVFSIFRDGLSCSELQIAPLGGALFGADTTPLLDSLAWGDPAVALLLDRLIWVTAARGERARVHYGSLDVEDLGSIYEGLLEQEPAIATEPLVRIRRGKQDVVVPAGDQPSDIAPGQFFLRAGQGRKATGSFYTPHEFVHFLVRETLDPKIAALSPPDDPQPARLLTLRIVDPSAGSGHFLVEACRYLGEALLNACRVCDQRGLHDRIAALPDPDGTIVPYLPSRGFSELRARAICRRLVAVHCLYGCDRNELAVELAKLSLWLESYAEGLPLTFLDHRLVHGDALTGPFFAALSTLPVTGGPLDPLLAASVSDCLDRSRHQIQGLVAGLNASMGRDIADLALKQATKDSLDRMLHPLRQLARAWTGAAMLHERDGDDVWLALAIHVADTGTWPEHLTPRQAALLTAGADAVAWDLTFPEVFPGGFSVVLGNPPWDVVLPSTKDFVAELDPSVLNARSAEQRASIQQAVLANPEAAAAFQVYRRQFDRIKRVAHRLYRHQRTNTGGTSTGGSLDLFRLFAERNIDLSAMDGAIGVLMPSAFHANDGTTAIRRLYLDETDLAWCLSFENRRRIFEIDSRFKFDLIVAHRPGPTTAFRCGFYLTRIEDVADPDKVMTYDRTFLSKCSGASLTPLELRGRTDLRIAEKLFAHTDRLRAWCDHRRIRFGCDLHMTADAGCFRPSGVAEIILHEGKTFHQYTDIWDTPPRYSVAAGALRPAIAEASRHHRLVFRDIARSNDERTMIACIAPPGVVFGHTATVEKTPWRRCASDAFVLCAIFNSFTFDWLVRQKAAAHLSLYILDALPLPRLDNTTRRFLAQGALSLTCNHANDAGLKQTQDDAEHSAEATRDQSRRRVTRAQIDAVVAHAYDLERLDYAHLLRSFSHRSFPDAAVVCLEAFDAFSRTGQPSFANDTWPMKLDK